MKFKKTFTGLQRIIGNPRVSYLYYVTDKANWSFYWDAYYITTALGKYPHLRALITHDPWQLRNSIIHFGDRYAYLDGPFRSLHASNHVFLTWFHGDRKDPNPDMQRLFNILPDAATYVQKLVVTCSISRQVLVELGIPETKIVTIPLGVDLMLFSVPTDESRLNMRDRLGIPKNAVCIGSFQKDGAGWGDGIEPKFVKGPDVFLEVVAKLHRQYNNIMILLTGPARGYVKKGLERLGVPYVHRFLSNYQDIVSYYHILDLYIITSRAEGGPKALLESWATGVPVVSTKVGMSADLIKHGVNGMIASMEDVEGLANGATQLIEDNTLRQTCRRGALEDVKHFDWSMIAEQYYQQLYQPFLK